MSTLPKKPAPTKMSFKTSDRLADCIRRREDIKQALEKLRYEQIEIDRDIKQMLIEDGDLDMLSPNWARLNKIYRV